MNSHDIDVKSLSLIRLFKWEDESWTSVNLSANYLKNDRVEATPYFLIPSNKGKYSVYIECEGFQAVKSIGGQADGCWTGLIAYDRSKEGWQARTYTATAITNYKASSTTVGGHPDSELNDCKFRQERMVESDFSCSFHLECDGDGYWALQAPPVQKSSDYNYVVSYANYTEKRLEWGSVSISIDEVNETASPSAWKGKPRNRDLVAKPDPTSLKEELESWQTTINSASSPPSGLADRSPGNQGLDQSGNLTVRQDQRLGLLARPKIHKPYSSSRWM